MEEQKTRTETPEEVKADEQGKEEGIAKTADPAAEGSERSGEEADSAEETAADAEQASGEDPSVKEEPQEAPAEEAKEPEKKERGLMRHRKELQKKDEKIAELTDRLQRQMAEFDNFRKRTDREKAVRFDDGAMFILEKLLPVVDNFERGLAQVPEEAKADPYVTGMEAIYKQMTAMLEGCGVHPIEAVGKEFDPSFHNAVMHVEDEESGENTVVEEFQKGYMYKEQILRHSMVKVAN